MEHHASGDTLTASRTRRRRVLLAILLGSSLATLGAGAMSLAVFTDTDSTDGAWSTGTIILGVSPATTFGPADMMPGDTGSQTITVNNTGTGDLRYAIKAVATDLDAKGLAAQLDFDVDAGACGATTGNLFSGTLATFTGLGDKAQGADPGDRFVAAGDAERLCFSWELPLQTTGNGFQDAGTKADFTFYAEQTANN